MRERITVIGRSTGDTGFGGGSKQASTIFENIPAYIRAIRTSTDYDVLEDNVMVESNYYEVVISNPSIPSDSYRNIDKNTKIIWLTANNIELFVIKAIQPQTGDKIRKILAKTQE